MRVWSAEGDADTSCEGSGLAMAGTVPVRISGCVAFQYVCVDNKKYINIFLDIYILSGTYLKRLPTSRYSAMCSQASSSWFSSRITSNISGGHWANFSAATICTDKFLACDLPRDLIKRCKTCKRKQMDLVIDISMIEQRYTHLTTTNL